MCQQVADSPSVDPFTAEKARALKLEWVRLQTPPATTLEEEKRLEAQRESLKKRMADFLAAVL